MFTPFTHLFAATSVSSISKHFLFSPSLQDFFVLLLLSALIEIFFVSLLPFCGIFFIDKSCNLFKFVSVLLSASVERVGVSRMLDFFYSFTFVQTPFV